jgi:hypothetical protein
VDVEIADNDRRGRKRCKPLEKIADLIVESLCDVACAVDDDQYSAETRAMNVRSYDFKRLKDRQRNFPSVQRGIAEQADSAVVCEQRQIIVSGPGSLDQSKIRRDAGHHIGAVRDIMPRLNQSDNC